MATGALTPHALNLSRAAARCSISRPTPQPPPLQSLLPLLQLLPLGPLGTAAVARGAGALPHASAQLKHPHRFASKTKRPGLLPRLLEALITTRRRTKALAKAAAQRGDTNEAECLHVPVWKSTSELDFAGTRRWRGAPEI